jgi:hypothetical protein
MWDVLMGMKDALVPRSLAGFLFWERKELRFPNFPKRGSGIRLNP